ncbi:MAG: PspC domain-containing protein [Bacteroidales bacterium]|nr:PspC domain-containing protein [Bacteroidales bacterium]
MTKKLYRSLRDRRIAGVCGGLTAYFGYDDATWLRLAWAVLTLLGGISIWVYLLFWLVVPDEPRAGGPVDEQ